MPVEITNKRAPVASIAIKDSQGHYCVKIAPIEGGAMFQHDPTGCVQTACVDASALRSLAEALLSIARDAEAAVSVRGSEPKKGES